MHTTLELCRKQIETRIDPRFIAFNVNVALSRKTIALSGLVHNIQVLTAFKAELQKAFPGRTIMQDSMVVLQRDFAPAFAQIAVPIAPMHRSPDSSSEQVSQEILGRMVRTYHSQGDWVFAQLSDGYLGWLRRDALIPKSPRQYCRWATGRKAALTRQVRHNDTMLPLGTELPLNSDGLAILPDGSPIRLPRTSYTLSWPARNPIRRRLLRCAKSLQRVKYLWGGKSHHGLDCSGFTQLNYELHGILIPRDASQQVSVGRLVGHLPDFSDILPGDLLFFMDEKAKVYHVGISLGRSRFIHASFVKQGVIIDDLKSRDPERQNKYYSKFLFAKSILM
ncbi:MAG: hypothetical protein Kow0059_14980 [Candidatus Sumerlaeia bacterium]